MRTTRLSLSAMAFVALMGCSESDNNATGPSAGSFTITGTVKNNKQTPIPANAKAVVVWSIVTSEAAIHILFGQGTVNPSDATFKIVLDKNPPAEVLQRSYLGAGSILLITEDWTEGVLPPDVEADFFTESNLIGAVDQRRVLFFNLKPSEFAKMFEDTGWAKEFKQQGYNVGSTGVPPNDFKPASASGLEAVIDTFENLVKLNF